MYVLKFLCIQIEIWLVDHLITMILRAYVEYAEYFFMDNRSSFTNNLTAFAFGRRQNPRNVQNNT